MVFETYKLRQRRLRGDLPDVYTYDHIPKALRIQIIQIMIEMLGGTLDYATSSNGRDVQANIRTSYQIIVSVLRKDLGVFVLPHADRSYSNVLSENFLAELTEFLLGEEDVELVLSAVELICELIENRASKRNYRGRDRANEAAKDAIDEINARFKLHGVGYEYARQIIRIDAEFLHAEAVKPALLLLSDPKYAGAEQEFLSAHDHYRKSQTKEALADSLKAIESTMKIICSKRGWVFAPTDTAKKLIDVCFANGLIPSYWQSHFTSLRSMLEGSVPTVRNKTSGHGQGAVIQDVPEFLASYVLHMTAATIVFLVKAEEALP